MPNVQAGHQQVICGRQRRPCSGGGGGGRERRRSGEAAGVGQAARVASVQKRVALVALGEGAAGRGASGWGGGRGGQRTHADRPEVVEVEAALPHTPLEALRPTRQRPLRATKGGGGGGGGGGWRTPPAGRRTWEFAH
eukprot:SAG11_NODE_568_length_8478_cov_24.289891_4_plen_138_part_00